MLRSSRPACPAGDDTSPIANYLGRQDYSNTGVRLGRVGRPGPRDDPRKRMIMNRHERPAGEAVVEYLDSNLRLIKPGAFVRCAVTGQPIPLDQVKYWSVERQEAYSGPEAVLQRLGVKPRQP